MVKSTLVLVLRDVPMPVDKSLPPLREKFIANFRKTFQKAKKPKLREAPSFDDCFQASPCEQECSTLQGWLTCQVSLYAHYVLTPFRCM